MSQLHSLVKALEGTFLSQICFLPLFLSEGLASVCVKHLFEGHAWCWSGREWD